MPRHVMCLANSDWLASSRRRCNGNRVGISCGRKRIAKRKTWRATIERFAASGVRKVGRTSDGATKLCRKINRCPESRPAIGHRRPYISVVEIRSSSGRYVKKLNRAETDISVREDGSYLLRQRAANFSPGNLRRTSARGKTPTVVFLLDSALILSRCMF